jgi:hypothetical protein
MRCSNCHAECSDAASTCEFCGHPLSRSEVGLPPSMPESSSGEPPPLPTGFESDNPYASSDSSSIGTPQIPVFQVPNHLVLSIVAAAVSFFFCCFPFGLIAVVFSVQVNQRLARGDIEGAQSASEKAKLWAWICIGIALALFVLNMILQTTLGFNRLD